MSLKKAVELIRKNNNFLISTHTNPEADAIGSELAFFKLLRKLGKEAYVVNESLVPAECRFLPEVEKAYTISGKRLLRRPHQGRAPRNDEIYLNELRFDCVVFLDCSNLSRAGRVASFLKYKAHIMTLNIDHHISNTRFASVNWVDPKASSTCELIWRLYKHLRVPVDKDTAILLYAGILIDTGSFHYSNTTSEVHRIAASLLRFGFSVTGVYKELYENNPYEDIKLLGRLLQTMRRTSRGRIIWTDISLKNLGQKYPSIDLGEILLSLIRSVKGVELAIVFKEMKGRKSRLRMNFRSQSNFDCNALAAQFGGGGHKNASGATVEGDFDEIKRKVIRTAKKMMR